MKETITGFAQAAKAGIDKVNSTIDHGLETAEKVFIVVGSILIAGVALGAFGAYVAGQTALLPSN